ELPLSRQPTRVGGSAADGRKDGTDNAVAVISAFGRGYLSSNRAGTFIFLDVEPEVPLSGDYFHGWSESILTHGRPDVVLMPAIYFNYADSRTVTEFSRGSLITNVWIAKAKKRPPLPEWDERKITPPAALPGGLRIWAWQAVIDHEHLDYSLINPNPQMTDGLLRRLVLPPPVPN